MQRGIGFLFLAALIALFVAATLIVRHRRGLLAAAEEAAIGAAALSVRGKRKIADRASAYRQRVIAKADARESRTGR